MVDLDQSYHVAYILLYTPIEGLIVSSVFTFLAFRLKDFHFMVMKGFFNEFKLNVFVFVVFI